MQIYSVNGVSKFFCRLSDGPDVSGALQLFARTFRFRQSQVKADRIRNTLVITRFGQVAAASNLRVTRNRAAANNQRLGNADAFWKHVVDRSI